MCSGEGIGFAWSPLTLRVRIGDSVTWKWEFDVAKGSVYGAIVFTTASPTDDEYDGVGFRSSTVKSQKGVTVLKNSITRLQVLS